MQTLRDIYSCHMIHLWHKQTYCVVLTVAFLPVVILRVPQKKKSSSLEDLQSESLEKVGLFVFTISGVYYHD